MVFTGKIKVVFKIDMRGTKDTNIHFKCFVPHNIVIRKNTDIDIANVFSVKKGIIENSLVVDLLVEAESKGDAIALIKRYIGNKKMWVGSNLLDFDIVGLTYEILSFEKVTNNR